MSQDHSYFNSAQALDLISELQVKLEGSNELALITQYRKAGLDPQLIGFSLTQAKLRARAAVKFGDSANSMLFTESGLEQGTRAQVANWHASKFHNASIESITDLGAGIGSDSISFASNSIKVHAVENHPEAFQALKHNLLQFRDAVAFNSSAEAHQIQTQAIWLDPARREQNKSSERHQRFSPELYSPNLDFAFTVARKFPAGIKLAPGFPHDLIPTEFEANWVSHRGDLVELTLWSEPIGVSGVKKAVIIGDQVEEFEGTEVPGIVSEPKEFIYEPDVSLIRSHLIGNFADKNGLTLLAENIAYLSSDKELKSPWLKSFKVRDVLALDEKKIRAYCAAHGIGVLEIKKRGVDITPETLRPKLRLKGAGAATLILTKVGDARQAIVCDPIR